MKYGLLVARTLSNGTLYGNKNIGDYIQNLAALQFLPCVDEYYDRESKDHGHEKIKMIMNGWYMWNTEFFPPNERVIPLLTSMHFAPLIADEIMNKKAAVEWLKQYGPVGCRDKYTENLLKSNGIDTYFSGCLTLTLGRKYKYSGKREGIVFVDPYLSNFNNELTLRERASCIFYAIKHLRSWIRITKKFKHQITYDDALIRRIKYAAVFMKTYSNTFTFNEMENAEYVNHHIMIKKGKFEPSEEERLTIAENLLEKYLKASIVVTSRIHCALPCLALETPVIFVLGSSIDRESSKADAGRFEGLIELLNVAEVKGLNFLCDFDLKTMKNKKDYLQIAKKLEEECLNFIYDK